MCVSPLSTHADALLSAATCGGQELRELTSEVERTLRLGLRKLDLVRDLVDRTDDSIAARRERTGRLRKALASQNTVDVRDLGSDNDVVEDESDGADSGDEAEDGEGLDPSADIGGSVSQRGPLSDRLTQRSGTARSGTGTGYVRAAGIVAIRPCVVVLRVALVSLHCSRSDAEDTVLSDGAKAATREAKYHKVLTDDLRDTVTRRIAKDELQLAHVVRCLKSRRQEEDDVYAGNASLRKLLANMESEVWFCAFWLQSCTFLAL